MDGMLPVLLVVLGVGLILGVVVVAIYNGLVRLRNKADEAWSGIDVQLQRRLSLVPNLVEVVKGYANHEESVLVAVTEARSRAVGASGQVDRGTAEAELTQSLRSLFAVAEGYPELRADAGFRDLQAQLARLEDDIALSRRYHNATVEDLNTKIDTFPSVLVARAFGFERRGYFQAGDDAVAVPEVRL